MSLILCLATFVLALHAADSYILLTANLDDVQAIAKQLAESPVASQLKNIWRRASSQFYDIIEKNKRHRRAQDDALPVGVEDTRVMEDAKDQGHRDEELAVQRRRAGHQLQELNKNASFYLSSIKKIMDGI